MYKLLNISDIIEDGIDPKTDKPLNVAKKLVSA